MQDEIFQVLPNQRTPTMLSISLNLFAISNTNHMKTYMPISISWSRFLYKKTTSEQTQTITLYYKITLIRAVVNIAKFSIEKLTNHIYQA